MYLHIYKYSINNGLTTVGQSPPIDLDKQKTTTSLYAILYCHLEMRNKLLSNEI